MPEQPSRTEPPDTVPEFRPGHGPGPSGPRAPLTPLAPQARGEHAKWPRRVVRARLGYGAGGGRSTLPREAAPTGDRNRARHARPLQPLRIRIREHTPATPARRAGAAIETTEDRA
ncbi:hypothetical protein AB0E96_29370 [Kitasatospora sp. NPDC036755]|uniref:hypothetical protein n=1 Tax=Kitasatospora sp. NPDC036755 TaxID=3154600 RepID=UPI0033F149D6